MKVLLCIMCVIAIVDLFQYKIPNWCIILGITFWIVEKVFHFSGDSMVEGIAQMLICFIAFWPFYLLRGIGAGDVKLFMMMSLYFKKQELIMILFFTFLVAAAASFVKIVCFAEGRKRIAYLWRYIKKICITGCIDSYETPKEKEKTTIRLSLPALVSVSIWMMRKAIV